MAGARGPVIVSVYMCILGLMCCESYADSRAVYYREREAPVIGADGIDDGPETFTMQDHFNFLKERELAIRATADERRTHQAVILGTAASVSKDQTTKRGLIFVDDYSCTGSNNNNDPSLSCPPGR